MPTYRNSRTRPRRTRRRTARTSKMTLYKRPTKKFNPHRVYSFTRTTYPGNATFNTAVSAANGEAITNSTNLFQFDTGGNDASNITYFANSHYFSFGDLGNSNEFTALFEKYKIVGLQFKIISFNTVSSIDAHEHDGQGALSAIIHSVTDTNDNTVLTALGTGVEVLREKVSYRSANLISLRPFKRYVRPRCAIEIYGVGGTRFATSSTQPWLSTNDTDVPYYGVKYIVEVIVPDPAVHYLLNLKIECKYYLAFKDPY